MDIGDDGHGDGKNKKYVIYRKFLLAWLKILLSLKNSLSPTSLLCPQCPRFRLRKSDVPSRKLGFSGMMGMTGTRTESWNNDTKNKYLLLKTYKNVLFIVNAYLPGLNDFYT